MSSCHPRYHAPPPLPLPGPSPPGGTRGLRTLSRAPPAPEPPLAPFRSVTRPGLAARTRAPRPGGARCLRYRTHAPSPSTLAPNRDEDLLTLFTSPLSLPPSTMYITETSSRLDADQRSLRSLAGFKTALRRAEVLRCHESAYRGGLISRSIFQRGTYPPNHATRALSVHFSPPRVYGGNLSRAVQTSSSRQKRSGC